MNNFSLILLAIVLAFTRQARGAIIAVVPGETQILIQAAIDSSHPGDTISFQAGTYNLCNLHLAAGRTYLGANDGQTILHGPGQCSLMIFYGSGLTVQHFTFDGGGLYLGGAVYAVKVEYNTFQNIGFGPNATTEYQNWTTTIGIFIDTSATHSDFSYNSFHNLSSDILHQYVDWNLGVTGIFGYHLNGVTITYNTFDTVNEGIHVFSLQNTQVEHNTITQFHRVGMEFQDSTTNLDIGYNTISQPIAPFWVTFGMSIAITDGNANAHDNMIDDQVQKTCGAKCWIGYGIEAWGTNTMITRNTIQGHWGNGVAIGPSMNLQVVNNKICGPDMAQPGSAFVTNQKDIRWSGEVIANNASSTATKCN